MKNNGTRKRVYRVVAGGQVCGEHKQLKHAVDRAVKIEDCVAKSCFGLTPDTLVTIESWNGSSWQVMS